MSLPILAYLMVNWDDPSSKISRFFRVHEALWLPQWRVHHIPTEVEKANLLLWAAKMDLVRLCIKRSIHIHCWLRPVLNNPKSFFHGKDYNSLIGSKPTSAHCVGLACDWSAQEDCDITRATLLPMLETWNIRMEDAPGSTWVHCDGKPVPPGGKRFFNI